MAENFYNICKQILEEKDLAHKLQKSIQLHQRFIQDPQQFTFDPTAQLCSMTSPGRPLKPELVAPVDVAKRKLSSLAGQASLIHALAHIEFNAVNLAIDACYRFQEMPHEFIHDWLTVAVEEVYHFELLNQHLAELGYRYGDFPAHNGLWDMAHKTEHDVLARMALVPRVLEARGIDAVPEMQRKLAQINDQRAIAILDIIHQDEIKHVSFGDKWFKYCCQLRKLSPAETFFSLFRQYNAPKIRGAFNRQDRLKAGFSQEELNQLLSLTETRDEQ